MNFFIPQAFKHGGGFIICPIGCFDQFESYLLLQNFLAKWTKQHLRYANYDFFAKKNSKNPLPLSGYCCTVHNTKNTSGP